MKDSSDKLSHRTDRKMRRRHRILQATAVLPSLCTMFNGISGFGAIHFATKAGLGKVTDINLMIASGLIFVAMIFDMLDGRLARMTRKTSEFGAQLDSLCDAVSFGVAPAVLMLQAVKPIFDSFSAEHVMGNTLSLERLVWCIAAVYMSCGILRLARFNVENTPDESSHMSFKGLPIPGAAAAVASMTLLYAYMENHSGVPEHWLAAMADWRAGVALVMLPAITLITALLMVSRFRYPHVVNQYIRGKRSFLYLVRLVILVLAALQWPIQTIAVVILLYVLSGPVGATIRFFRRRETPVV